MKVRGVAREYYDRPLYGELGNEIYIFIYIKVNLYMRGKESFV